MSEVKCNPHLYAIIAGELSGDTLGAGLMKAILRHDPEAKFIGIGGPKMGQCGMVSAFNMEELSVMGFFEVAAHAIPILKIRSAVTKLLLKERPCVMVGIDAPDFNLAVEHALKKAGIKTVHYVSPSVWAWREKRIVKIKAACDEVLALLPFEKEFYDRHEMPCTYVGHTLANSIALNIDQNLARERCGLYKNCVNGVPGKVLAILPGSRKGIISRMLPIYARTAAILNEKIKDLTFVTVAPNRNIAMLIKDIWLEINPNLSLTVFVGNSQDVIASADACLLTCGTVAFETMLLKCPMVVAYKVSRLSAMLARRLLKVSMYSLPNLLAKREIVKELIQEDCTPIKLAHECIRLLTSDNLLMKKEFLTIHEAIRTNTDELAARAVLRVAAQGQEQVAVALTQSQSKLPDHEVELDQLALSNLAKKPTLPSLSEEIESKKRKEDSTDASATGAYKDDQSLKSDNVSESTKSDTPATKGKKSKRSRRRKNKDNATQAAIANQEIQASPDAQVQGSQVKEQPLAENSLESLEFTISADAAQNAAGYRDFLDKTKGINLETKAADELPLKHGLDDKTIYKLEQEVKEQEPRLSLNEVLSMPNKGAKRKNRDIIKRVTERI